MKMIISDFDDTFNNNLEKNIKYANKFMNDGNIFVIATGSSYQSYNDKLNGNIFIPNYIIANHGTLIYKNGNIIFEKTINKDLVDGIYNIILKEYNISYFFCNKDIRMSQKPLDKTVKINIEFKNKKDAIKFKNKIIKKFGKYVNCYLMYDKVIEIISIDTSKIIAINKIINIEKIDKDDVYTIGDGYNDLEMIKLFKGYAMKSSVKELKQTAIETLNNVHELIQKIEK